MVIYCIGYLLFRSYLHNIIQLSCNHFGGGDLIEVDVTGEGLKGSPTSFKQPKRSTAVVVATSSFNELEYGVRDAA